MYSEAYETGGRGGEEGRKGHGGGMGGETGRGVQGMEGAGFDKHLFGAHVRACGFPETMMAMKFRQGSVNACLV
jgi:hypothetical protein